MTSLAQASPAAQPSKPVQRRIPRSVYIALAFGVIAGASAGTSTKFALAEGAAPLTIAAFRLGMAALILTPWVLARHINDLRQLTGRDMLLAAFAGVWMALHFILWTEALVFASVLVATVIVCSSPIWTALLEVTILKARLTRLIVWGLALAVIGNVVIALGSSASGGTNQVLGGFIAMIAAVAIAAQRTMGRSLRQRIPIIPFLWVMYTFGTVLMALLLLITGTPMLGHTPQAYFWMMMLTLLPQLMGHGAFNYALGYFSATYTSLIIQMQPPLASLIAVFALSEVPGVLQIIGGAIIVAGVVMAVRGQQNISASEAVQAPET
jgi:drug/metabolite transporter (DMT)-like permease